MKGQSSIELLVTFGVVLAFTIPVIFLLFSVSSLGYGDMTKSQADATARVLADNINIVYGMGNGTKHVLLVNAPASTENITVSSKEVGVRVKLGDSYYDGSAPIFAEILKPVVLDSKSSLFSVNITNYNGKVVVDYGK